MTRVRPAIRPLADDRLSVRTLPAPGLAEIRVIAASPDTAQLIAEVLRKAFDATEPRSYPADRIRGGTRLHLTVDTETGRTHEGPDQPHEDEIA
ncbi:hypothetical protein [Streptomyces sp. NPDC051569]|uniref:hypothetical protein n=1 Tax=Streptomyces sp. NPDC051569 TaxID=3365661 RepID=UPI00379F4554